jgi:hypothetical protein
MTSALNACLRPWELGEVPEAGPCGRVIALSARHGYPPRGGVSEPFAL